MRINRLLSPAPRCLVFPRSGEPEARNAAAVKEIYPIASEIEKTKKNKTP